MTPSSIRRMGVAAVLAALAATMTSAYAQTVYRCGPAGNQYSQQPCAEGRAVDVSDRRNAEQVAQARTAVRDQQRLGAEMAKERRAEEAAHRPARAGGISLAKAAEPAKKPVAKPKHPKKHNVRPAVPGAESADFVAGVPGSGRKKKSQG